VSIGAVYVATETERLDVRHDLRAVADLYDLTVGLSNAIRDQEAGLDDYLLSSDPGAVARYGAGLETELRLTERMHQVALIVSESPAIAPALDALTTESHAWRVDFAQPAIAAVDHGSKPEISRIIALVATDQEPTLAGVGELIAQITAAQAAVELREDALTEARAIAVGVGIALMLLAATASLVLVRRWVTDPLGRLLATATEVQTGADVAFVTERDDEIGRLGRALERMRTALQLDVDRSSILNRFTEVTTFAGDDSAVAGANLEALKLLVQPDAGVTHVLNRSKARSGRPSARSCR